jgi:hypothetical protein
VTSCIVVSAAIYIMVVKFRNTIWPPPPQLSLHRRAAPSSNSNGTRSVYGRQNPKSSLYCEVSVRRPHICSQPQKWREKKKLNSFIKFDFLLASFCIKMPTMGVYCSGHSYYWHAIIGSNQITIVFSNNTKNYCYAKKNNAFSVFYLLLYNTYNALVWLREISLSPWKNKIKCKLRCFTKNRYKSFVDDNLLSFSCN